MEKKQKTFWEIIKQRKPFREIIRELKGEMSIKSEGEMSIEEFKEYLKEKHPDIEFPFKTTEEERILIQEKIKRNVPPFGEAVSRCWHSFICKILRL